jgi:aminomethyltransferase
MDTDTSAQKTVLYDRHCTLGAKTTTFGGFLMPLQYKSILTEHTTTRTAASVFDTCHMGEFFISGESCLNDLERLLSAPVESMKIGSCRYGFLCNSNGGVIDDQILYRLGEREFMMVVNAGTQANDFSWIQKNISEDTTLENRSEQTAKLDVQGPDSPRIVQRLVEEKIDELKYYRFHANRYRGTDIIISRTGYTGEIGFELYCPVERAVELFDELCESGVMPAGLGARDTLRLEMGYPLYGHELDETRNAGESGFARAIAPEKEFIGSDIVRDSSRHSDVLVGLQMKGRRAARSGDTVCSEQGEQIGAVTSGSFSPSIHAAIALAYCCRGYHDTGTHVKINAARFSVDAEVVELPFYKDGTARKEIAKFL